MKRALFSLLCFALVGGCSPRDQAARHEKNAREDVNAANQDLREGRAKANEDLRKADEERAKAAEDRARAERDQIESERVPVAGRQSVAMEKDLQDKLGDDWTVVRRSEGGYLAVRRVLKRADDKLDSKVDDTMATFRKDHHDAMVRRSGAEIILAGPITDCDDILKSANSFAKIDGINRLVVDLTCYKK